jgi:transaldolase
MHTIINELNIKLFADGADVETMVKMAKKPLIKGLTTNPTLMRKAGVENYREFATEVLKEIKDKPISFEVFTDNLDEMVSQGIEIASWGKNVNVKIPITNTSGTSTHSVIKHLSELGIPLNVTAIFTLKPVGTLLDALSNNTPSYVSIFAGRIADTGRDPRQVMREALEILRVKPLSELIWASPRELLNVVQADEIGCHIITATADILNKIEIIGKDLNQYSLETVKMFYDDAMASGYTLYK